MFHQQAVRILYRSVNTLGIYICEVTWYNLNDCARGILGCVGGAPPPLQPSSSPQQSASSPQQSAWSPHTSTTPSTGEPKVPVASSLEVFCLFLRVSFCRWTLPSVHHVRHDGPSARIAAPSCGEGRAHRCGRRGRCGGAPRNGRPAGTSASFCGSSCCRSCSRGSDQEPPSDHHLPERGRPTADEDCQAL